MGFEWQDPHDSFLPPASKRPIYFKARKLSNLAAYSFKKELTKPKYQGTLSQAQMAEATAALASKMHWAVQVGKHSDPGSLTFELEQVPGTGQIGLAKPRPWTERERGMQIRDFVPDERVGYTTLSDKEIEDIALRVIDIMRRHLSTFVGKEGSYNELYCNCQHFVYILVPAIATSENTLFNNTHRLPYKWSKLRKSENTSNLVATKEIETTFTSLSRLAISSPQADEPPPPYTRDPSTPLKSIPNTPSNSARNFSYPNDLAQLQESECGPILKVMTALKRQLSFLRKGAQAITGKVSEVSGSSRSGKKEARRKGSYETLCSVDGRQRRGFGKG